MLRLEIDKDQEVIEPSIIKAEKNRITVFVGFNATLKSMVARSFDPRGIISNNLNSIGVKYDLFYNEAQCIVKGRHADPSPSECETFRVYFLDEARIALRKYLAESRSRVENLREKLQNTIKYIFAIAPPTDVKRKEELQSEAEKLIDELIENIEELALGILHEYIRIKPQIHIEDLNNALKIRDKVLEEMLKKEGFKKRGISSDIVLPLTVYASIIEKDGRPQISIVDKRFGKKIELLNVSSTIASILLFDFIALFYAVPSDRKVLIVEEPELGMTPLMQVAFMKYASRLCSESKYETYLIFTTHSPYIAAAGVEGVDSYYLGFDPYKKRFVVEEGKHLKPFSLADLAI